MEALASWPYLQRILGIIPGQQFYSRFLLICRITIPKEKLIHVKKTLKISITLLSQGNCVSKYECHLAKSYIPADNFKYLKENMF